jgi:hypothetical protein
MRSTRSAAAAACRWSSEAPASTSGRCSAGCSRAAARRRAACAAHRAGRTPRRRATAPAAGALRPGGGGADRPRDRARIVRALEVRTKTAVRSASIIAPCRSHCWATGPCFWASTPGRERLRQAISARTRRMLEDGLLEEVRGLIERHGPSLRPLRAVGYRQAADVLAGPPAGESARARDRQGDASVRQTPAHVVPQGARDSVVGRSTARAPSRAGLVGCLAHKSLTNQAKPLEFEARSEAGSAQDRHQEHPARGPRSR